MHDLVDVSSEVVPELLDDILRRIYHQWKTHPFINNTLAGFDTPSAFDFDNIVLFEPSNGTFPFADAEIELVRTHIHRHPELRAIVIVGESAKQCEEGKKKDAVVVAYYSVEGSYLASALLKRSSPTKSTLEPWRLMQPSDSDGRLAGLWE